MYMLLHLPFGFWKAPHEVSSNRTGEFYKCYRFLLYFTLVMYKSKGVYFCGCALVGEVAMARNLLTTSVKLGLSDGSADQHCSINELH
jgi:hypothetical protein